MTNQIVYQVPDGKPGDLSMEMLIEQLNFMSVQACELSKAYDADPRRPSLCIFIKELQIAMQQLVERVEHVATHVVDFALGKSNVDATPAFTSTGVDLLNNPDLFDSPRCRQHVIEYTWSDGSPVA